MDEPIINAAKSGFTLRYKNKTLLSAIDPVSQAEKTVMELFPPDRLQEARQDRTLYFCPSPLFGYGLETLLSHITQDSAVLCVETDEKLFSLSVAHISKNLLTHPRFVLTNKKSGEDLCVLIREKYGGRAFRRIEMLKLSGGWQLDTENYSAMQEIIRSSLAIDWSNAMTIVKLGRRFMYNVIENISLLGKAKPITDFYCTSKPVLVLGAGPSLDPLLDNLEKAGVFKISEKNSKAGERNFMLVCVDSCLTLLKERGIVPDLAVILESQYWNLRDFLGSRNTGIKAAIDLSSYPGSVALLGGPVYFFYTPWTPLRFFERFNAAGLLPLSLPPLGSVGLTAVELSKKITNGTIITGGIDFSFTLDSLHARSSPAHLARLLSQNRFTSLFNADAIFRPGVFDTFSKSHIPVKSDPAMRMYRNLFENEFSGGRIKDITGSGLYLGLETISIEKAIEILTAEYPRQTIQSLQGDGKNPDDESEKMHLVHDFIKKEKALLLEIRSFLTGSSFEDTQSCKEENFETLLDKADYLWSHFPDCAGREGKRPAANDMVFIKRVRAEIDAFIKRWEMAEKKSQAFFPVL